MMAGIIDSALDGGARIGRYFSIVSMVPTTIFTLYVADLLASGAWSSSFQSIRMIRFLLDPNLPRLALLLLASLFLGLAMHPLQFSLTQILEGYWGLSSSAVRLASIRVNYHRALARRLEREIECSRDLLYRGVDQVLLDGGRRGVIDAAGRIDLPRFNQFMNGNRRGDELIGSMLRVGAAEAARAQYPKEKRRILPTRLGNALRRYEDSAGLPYGLDALTVAPHISLVAKPDHRAYVDDTRQQLDLTVRMCVLSLLAAAISVALLLDDGPWLLLALAPYTVAYLSYRGAIASAHSYGSALQTMLDLDRFTLYDELRVAKPRDANTERQHNAGLMSLLARKRVDFDYEYPSPPSNE